MLGLAEDGGAARAAQVLWVCGGDHVGDAHRGGVGAAGDAPGEVGDVGREDGPHLVGDGPEGGEVELARVRRGPAPQELGAVLEGRGRAPEVEIDALVVDGGRRRQDFQNSPVTLTFQPWVRWPPKGRPRPMMVSPGLAKATYTARLAGLPE